MPERCFKIADSVHRYDDEINKNFDCDDPTLINIPKGSKYLQKWIDYPVNPSYNYSDGGYLCTSGEVIPSNLKCDGKEDCMDGSDEGEKNGCPNLAKGIYV